MGTSVTRSSTGGQWDPASIFRLRRERPASGGAKDSADIFRRIVIEVDGRPAVRMGRGKTVNLAVEPGQHSVRARADWQTSPTLQVEISAAETVTVRVAQPFRSISKLLRNTDTAIRIERV